MPENKNGLSDAVEKGAYAANAIKTAAALGKTVSAASKGAAVGGSFGAVVGALWANRKLAGIILAATSLVIMLPVLFILMLPSIIFGSLTASYVNDSDIPILNDNSVIIENIDEVSEAVSVVLSDGIHDVIARIATDFAASGADNYEIVNPFEASPAYNTNLFISQYCAMKGEDFSTISIEDLENTLRREKSELYAFTRTEEVREIVAEIIEPPAEPPSDTSATFAVPPEPVYEIWHIYTIVYNGESHFADKVFKLSDAQKSLSRDYAQNLGVFLNDGSYQYLGTGIGTFTYEGVIFSDGTTPVIYYNQGDARYKDEPYGLDNVGGYGCGPTSMAIVISSLTDENVDPVQMAEWSYINKYWYSGGGSYHALIPAAAEEWGLPVEGCTASEPQRIVDALSSGKLVVAIMAKGHFTSSGHFIVLRGVTSSGTILVADPGSYKRSEMEWDLSIILNEASKRAGSGGPFWLIG